MACTKLTALLMLPLKNNNLSYTVDVTTDFAKAFKIDCLSKIIIFIVIQDYRLFCRLRINTILLYFSKLRFYYSVHVITGKAPTHATIKQKRTTVTGFYCLPPAKCQVCQTVDNTVLCLCLPNKLQVVINIKMYYPL